MELLSLAVFLGLDVLLFVFAARRPFAAFVVLLAGLPFNGFLTRVVGHVVAPTQGAEVALAAWHDALLLGIALAAVQALRVIGWRRLGIVERLVGAVLALGVVYVVAAPFIVTAAYVYRTLYEPPLLAAALLVLARARGLPAWLAPRAALALVGAGSVAALYAVPQVYLFGFRYLNLYYKAPGLPLDHSFLATGITQPRAVGTFSSPNEFGAYLAICLGLLVVPRLIPLPGWLRAWMGVAVGLALLLTFSRSGWVSAGIAILVGLWLSRHDLPRGTQIRAALASRAALLRYVPPFVAAVVLAVVVSVTAGVPGYVDRTVGGDEPSASNRIASVRGGLTVLREHPLGLGLGTAGPKAVRFGETSGQPRILTETWPLLYAIQTGIDGMLLFTALVLAVFVGLWRSRAGPWSRAAIALGLGLGVGALFIPVIEDPAVFTPLWAIGGLALAIAAVGASVPADVHPDGPSEPGREGDGPRMTTPPP